ncbi:UNVERIFIED_CONTAM: hypothetical protein FKN15_055766 [Acipenser sinensis]
MAVTQSGGEEDLLPLDLYNEQAVTLLSKTADGGEKTSKKEFKEIESSTSQPQIPSEESELVSLLASGTSPSDAGRSGSSISCHAWLWLSGRYLTSPHRKHHPSSSGQAKQTSGIVETRWDLRPAPRCC